MPSNYKKRVRARMQEHGESWQTAARHVRGQGESKEEPPASLAWYWRFEVNGDGWTIAACAKHGAKLAGEYRFKPHPRAETLPEPPCCPFCDGALTFTEVARCRCEGTPACPVHPSPEGEWAAETEARMREMRDRRPGDYPWDHWKTRALAEGVSEELASLGRSLVREFYQHSWATELGAFCGYAEDARARMIELAKSRPDVAAHRWKRLLETDGLRGEWKRAEWVGWSEERGARELEKLIAGDDG